jgi:hypothetical protein
MPSPPQASGRRPAGLLIAHVATGSGIEIGRRG